MMCGFLSFHVENEDDPSPTKLAKGARQRLIEFVRIILCHEVEDSDTAPFGGLCFVFCTMERVISSSDNGESDDDNENNHGESSISVE
jgi:hypothetical protein